MKNLRAVGSCSISVRTEGFHSNFLVRSDIFYFFDFGIIKFACNFRRECSFPLTVDVGYDISASAGRPIEERQHCANFDIRRRPKVDRWMNGPMISSDLGE